MKKLSSSFWSTDKEKWLLPEKMRIKKLVYGTMKPSNCTIKINKLDEDTLTQLKGAKFKIYMVKIEDGKFVEVQPREVTNYTGSKILETDDKGKLIDSNIMYDQYYCYEEIGNPKGYTGTVKGYVLFDGNEPKQNVESEMLLPK